jgi:hypothetical protein
MGLRLAWALGCPLLLVGSNLVQVLTLTGEDTLAQSHKLAVALDRPSHGLG